MNRRARIGGAMLLSLAVASTGCANKSPWQAWGGAPDLPPPASAAAGGKSDPMAILAKYDGSGDQSFAQPSVQPPRASGAQASSGGVVGAVSSAVGKTKDALTIKPKVVPAPDAVSLTDMPASVGPEVYLASARLHESQGKIAKAEENYRKALESAPNDWNVLVHYARMHDRAGNLDRAVEIYRQAIAAHPQEAAAYNDLGLCYARQNRLAESVEALQHAVRLRSDNVLYRNNVATVLVEMGRTDEAISHLTAAHGPAIAHYNLGYLLYKGGKPQEAAMHVQRALEYDPRMAAAERLLATITAPPATHRREAAPTEDAALSLASDARIVGQANRASNSFGSSRPQPLPAVENDEGSWGDAPTPDRLPQLLPAVR